MLHYEFYLSLVLAVRNDNYGGDFISRLQKCINWNSELLDKNKIKTEFILINWNPIKDHTDLINLIDWPKNHQFVTFRIIEVPSETHDYFIDKNNIKPLPLLEYPAKNVGIKRAKGQFILAMNPDILLNKSIIETIAKYKLKNNLYYRANRLDFDKEIFNPNKLWLKGFKYTIMHLSKINYTAFKIMNNIRCFWRKNTVKLKGLLNILSIKVYYHNAEYKFHCNVSGDFMLMHSTCWQTLGGYPEKSKIALHVDALMVVMAATSGLKEFVFKDVIYHQNHNRHFDAENGNELYSDAYNQFQTSAQEMIRLNKNSKINDDNWGLANFELKETTF